MTFVLFGIANCDTVRKARLWLDQHQVPYLFHDFKKQGVERSVLEQWVEEHSLDVVLNRASATFRALPDADKIDLNDQTSISLMIAQPSMIKRPVLDLGRRRIVGFKPALYDEVLT